MTAVPVQFADFASRSLSSFDCNENKVDVLKCIVHKNNKHNWLHCILIFIVNSGTELNWVWMWGWSSAIVIPLLWALPFCHLNVHCMSKVHCIEFERKIIVITEKNTKSIFINLGQRGKLSTVNVTLFIQKQCKQWILLKI